MATIANAVDRLFSNARTKLPGAVDNMLKLELHNVLDEFFQTTKAWKEDVDFTLVAGVDTYDIIIAESGVIEGLYEVKDADGYNVSATMETIGVLKLATKPTTAGAVYTATVSKTVVDPTDGSDIPVYPDWVLEKYFQCILNGLIGAMMAHKAKPYTDERLAIFHQRKFRSMMSSARATVRRQNTYTGAAWKFPAFA